MGLSGEIVLAGRSSQRSTRPSFETQPGLQRLKVVPTTLASRSPAPEPAGDCGVWHNKELIALNFLMVRDLLTYERSHKIMTQSLLVSVLMLQLNP